MNVVAMTDSIETGEDQRRFIVNLMSEKGETPYVRSCEVVSSAFRNRTSFVNTMPLEEVFCDSIAEGLNDCVNMLSGETQVISLPSLILEVPGLVLAGAHILTTVNDDGSQSIIIRFRISLGGIGYAFRPDVGFGAGLEDLTREVSAQVLTDLALPLLNVLSATEAGLVDAESAIGSLSQQLADRVHEIRFQIELVKRYTDGLERQRNNPQGADAVKDQPRRLSSC
ncbi:hypothetical protein [Phaeobacter inhibens]|uniref:hypothetical protein n=2 Tax=Phaeobacter inhibens TaxID=221822 RepID=UPI000C99CE2B|nr:hypothetical protein [Phaeobacter inhibens]AUQ66481.1 hypothetical protein PhaeoP78_01616 [Phaeobacter inhibens]UWR50705.1 hypothetical protein K4F87_08160 [Phaeobacter inhibens]UWS01973.1 hypothetical protein K4L03_08280 [Phaeobacter inhibens]UWS05710.1 hypothetical protein K4K94_08310 [Phaeobacter inhibens]